MYVPQTATGTNNIQLQSTVGGATREDQSRTIINRAQLCEQSWLALGGVDGMHINYKYHAYKSSEDCQFVSFKTLTVTK